MSSTVYLLGEAMLELAPLEQGQYCLGVAGDTFNTAVTLAGLGVGTQYLTATGAGPVGHRIIDALSEHGVGGELLHVLPDSAPGLYLISLDARGERSFTYWRQHSAARDLFHDSAILETLLAKINPGQWLFLSGITLAIASSVVREQLLAFIARYRSGGGKFAFDCNYRAALWESSALARDACTPFMQACDLFLPGADDLRAMWGLPAEALTEFIATTGAPCTVLKQGGDDVMIVQGDEWASITCVSDPSPVDTTGAGDAFNGAFLAAHLAGLSARAAVRFAHEVAADVITEKGAMLPRERWALHRAGLTSYL